MRKINFFFKLFFKATRRIYESKKNIVLNKSNNIINFLSSENTRINILKKTKKFIIQHEQKIYSETANSKNEEYKLNLKKFYAFSLIINEIILKNIT